MGEAIAPLPGQHSSDQLDAPPQEEGVRAIREPLERPEGGSGTEERIEQGLGALGRQGVEPKLRVAGLAAPAMHVLGAVVDEEEHPGRRQALDQAVQDGLGLAVDPVEVLEDDEQRLDLSLAQEQALHRVQGALTALRRVKRRPRGVVDRHVEQRQESGHGGLQGLIQRQEPAGDLLADGSWIILVLNLQVALEQVDHGQVRRGLPVRNGARLHDEPPVGPVGVRHLPDQSRLPDARLPDESDHLTGPRSRPTDGLAHLFQLRLPADEPREAAGRRGVQPRAKWPRSRHLIEVDRRAQALDGHWAERRDRDEPFRESEHVGGQQSRVGLGELLHTCGEVRGLPDRRVVHPEIAADGAHDHFARVQADADLITTRDAAGLLGIATNRRHVERGVARPHGPRGPPARRTAP